MALTSSPLPAALVAWCSPVGPWSACRVCIYGLHLVSSRQATCQFCLWELGWLMELPGPSCESLSYAPVSCSLMFGISRPSITGTVWGFENLGRNFGIVSYAPFIGTPLFTYLYACLGSETCSGRECWSSTFVVCGAAMSMGMVGSVMLWKRWHEKL